MIHDQMQTSKILIGPGTDTIATNATATGVVLDCKGYDYASIDVLYDTCATNPATLQLAEGDVTTIGTAIAAFTGDDTTNGFTIPAADTSNQAIVRFNVDLRKRKRYLSVQITPAGAGLYAIASARLSRRHEAYSPSGPTDAELGCKEIVNG